MRLQTSSISDIGLVRMSNQDAIGCYPELGLFVLADGMGGHGGGERASVATVEAVREHLEGTRGPQAKPDGPAPEVDASTVEAAIGFANQRIMDEQRDAPRDKTQRVPGSTVVVLMIDIARRSALWGHVGDSRLYRLRAGGLALLTADHTVFGVPYRDESFVPVELPHTNVLMQALGQGSELEVAAKSASVEPGDLFLLCSDGISGMIDAGAIEGVLRSTTSLDEKANALVRLALEASGRDNASAILVQAGESGGA